MAPRRCSVGIAAALLLRASPALAQIEAAPSLLSAETDDARALDWGDRDGDGDLDLVIGTGPGSPLRVYRNDGGALTLAWSSAETDDTTSVAWGDLDRDGDLDLAVGNRGAPVRLYRDDAGLLALTWSSPEIGQTRAVAWGDWDADHDLDLAVANGGAEPDRLYRSRGGTLDLQWTSTELDDGRALAWGDVDGDGDPDLAVGNFGQPNRVYRNDGFALTLLWSSAELDPTTSLAWGDLDGDGALDLAVGNAGPWTPRRVYRNDGLGGLTLAWSSAELEDSAALAWGDVDGDRDLDLAFSSGGASPLRIYLNSAGTLAPGWSSGDAIASPALGWGDLDGDNDLELAAAGAAGPGAVALRVYRNRTAGLRGVAAVGAPDDAAAVALGDFDGDLDLDLAVGNAGSGEPDRVYRNDRGALTLHWTSPERERTAALAWGDLDGDFDLDLAVANLGAGEPARVYANQGGTLVAAWASPETGSGRAVAWGDLDLDGDLDLAVGREGSPSLVYRNDGAGGLQLAWSAAEVGATAALAWSDWDGDLDFDLAVGNAGPGEPIRVYRNDGGSLTLAWSSSETDGTRALAWGDLDGDGRLDLAAGNDPGPDRVYRNTCGALTLAWSAPSPGATHALAWGDWEGDGDLDLAGGSALWGELLYRNDGGTFVEVWSASGAAASSVAWGDLDDDGDLELWAARGRAGTAVLDGTPERRGAGLPESTTYPVIDGRPGRTPAAAFVSTGEVLPVSTGILVWYRLFDAGSDRAWRIRGEYSLDGGGRWQPATKGPLGATTNLAATPAGEPQVFEWNALADGAWGSHVVFRIGVEHQAPDAVARPVQLGRQWAVSAPFRVQRESAPTLTIRKAALYPSPLLPGGTITFQVLIENTGVGDAVPLDVVDVLDDPNLGEVNPPRNLVCPAGGVGSIDLAGPDPVVSCRGMRIAASGRPFEIRFDVDVDDPFVPGSAGAVVCNQATMIYECNSTPSDPRPALCIPVVLPGCVVGSLTPRRLQAVREGAAGARFTGDLDPVASEYHLNSVLDKADLVSPGPHRPPVAGGVGTAECEARAPASACSDPDAMGPPALRFYQFLSACGPGGLDEGPVN